ncbi:ABC transporter ATP-binding protein [Ihuprevotella massiliensis]|uniref:ABC transporter ATP-binding protein n=1 Tax=Ihuprevotella massiliensis TaxID=1852368 RepID=UPI00094F38BC
MQFALRNLTFGHRGKPLLPPLTLTLESGQLVALIGRNGSGKSTLLQTLAGLLPSLAGQMRIKTSGRHCPESTLHADAHSIVGKVQQSGVQPLCEESSSGATTQEEWIIDFSSLSPAERARWVSIVLPTTPEIPPLTVLEVVQLGRLPHRHASLSQRDEPAFVDGVLHSHASLSQRDEPTFVDSVLHRCGIAHLASRPMHALSDGQRQRVMLARAVAQDTPIMLLDEPTNFLDFQATQEVFQLLSHLAHEEQKLVIVATHHLDWAKREADKTLEIRC